MNIRKPSFLLLVSFVALASLLVLGSCSTSKTTTSRKGTAGMALKAPDYKRIKKEIGSKDGKFYYPELLRRFQAADTTLTPEQIYHFYYGTATRADYNPYKTSNYNDLNEALSSDTITQEDWRRAAQVVEKELETDPTNLRFHLYKQYVYSNLYGKESEETVNAYIQVVMLFSAIASSGNGRSPETAFHVISTTDEYGLMELLGFSPKSQSLMEKHGRSYDLMELKENEYGLESMYFDVTICLEALHKSLGF